MGTAYTLSLFDPLDKACDGVDTKQLQHVEQVITLLKMIERARPGANPRFERLMALLDCAHPGHGVSFSGCADGLPMHSPGSADHLFGPGSDQAVVSVAIDLDQCDLAAVMPDLLFWSRELGLDVFDELQGIFLPWRGLPLPKDTGIEFAVKSGWATSLRTWNNALELRQALIDKLTRLLVLKGFSFRVEPGYDAVFERETDDGFQRIAACLGGEHPLFTCKFDIEQGSRRFTKAMRQAGYALGNPNGLRLVIDEQLVSFRRQLHPGWDRLSAQVVHQVWTHGWLDWMLDDLCVAVLPALDKARSMDGLSALYNDPAQAGFFPRAVRPHGDVSTFAMLPALAAAFFAKSAHFEPLASRCALQFQQRETAGRVSGEQEQFNRLLATLRMVGEDGLGQYE